MLAILTIGNLSSEVEKRLKQTKESFSKDGPVDLMVKGIEAKIKTLTNRNFETVAFTQQPHDVDVDQDVIFLTEVPVTTFTSLDQVTSRDPVTGLPDGTQVINRDTYLVDNDAGIVQSLVGPFPRGRGAVLTTYQGGYTAGEIAGNTKMEILLLKELLMRIIDREWKIWDQGERHLASVSLGDQSFTLQTSMTKEDRKDISLLSLPVAFR